ncbi:CPBP family intramembrane glutamic endopeptidase [Amphibacillus jilinensis]|uniref:CPBP family intramembrane glutamic endopeptidase n=1 Tax=Amphibacillus jilinensis TaxID=1216008 RepID=UPI001F49B8BF|nr:type II CAAX endopeptidase family protein [Amphibacillus jilinensis]
MLLFVLGLASMFIYWRFRPASYESSLLPEEKAVRIATDYINQLVGVDVSKWRWYTSYWYDHKLINRMHKLNLLDRWRHLLFDWGIVEAWRIRFIDQDNSIVINISAKGEITFLSTTIRDAALYNEAHTTMTSSADVISQIKHKHSCIWDRIEATGEGERTEELANIKHYWYMISQGDLRMKITVILEDGRVTEVVNDTEINTSDMQAIVRKEYRETALNLSGFIGSLIAVTVAIFVLINIEQVINVYTSIALTGLMIVSILLTAADDIKLSLINAYDSRLTVRSIYTVGVLSALVGIIAYGFLMFLLSFVGLNLAYLNGSMVFQNPITQLLAGIGTGFLCLSLTNLLFHFLQQHGFLRIAPELSSRSTFLSGYKYKQSISMSIQSALLEEVIYRLLGISLLSLFINQTVIAIVVTSILWACLHQGLGFSSSLYRGLQLVIIGMILGVVYVYFGFLTVFVAHFIYNFLMTSLPLIDYQMSKRKVKRQPLAPLSESKVM